jgi:hypothetical protein
MPTPEMEIGTAADPPLFGAAFGSEKASQGAHTARTMEIDRSKASITPKAAAKGASRGKILAASTGSGASSQSSANQLQKEWADTASSIGSTRGHKAKCENLTLAKLSRQLSTVKASLGDVNLQFVEAEKTVNVSNMFLAFGFFYRLHRCVGWATYRLRGEAGRSMTDFSPTSPRVSR